MAPTGTRRTGLLTLWHHHPLKFHIAALFTVLIFAACGAIAWSNHVQTRNMVLSSAEDLIDRIDNGAGSALNDLFSPVEALVTWIAGTTASTSGSIDAREALLPVLADVLEGRPQIAAIYIGYGDVDFFLMRALRDDASRKAFDAPQHAAFLAQSIEWVRSEMRPRRVVYDADLKPLSDVVMPEYRFDPRSRPWYLDALKTSDLVLTAPYVFFTTRQVGLTIARRARHGRAVVGADVALS